MHCRAGYRNLQFTTARRKTECKVNKFICESEIIIIALLIQIAGLQSTSEVPEPEQDLGPTYADIHSTTPFSINNNIFLQLDDDCVQYAQVKPQESQNMDYGNCGNVIFPPSDFQLIICRYTCSQFHPE